LFIAAFLGMRQIATTLMSRIPIAKILSDPAKVLASRKGEKSEVPKISLCLSNAAHFTRSRFHRWPQERKPKPRLS
jgi:hypothetical protein